VGVWDKFVGIESPPRLSSAEEGQWCRQALRGGGAGWAEVELGLRLTLKPPPQQPLAAVFPSLSKEENFINSASSLFLGNCGAAFLGCAVLAGNSALAGRDDCATRSRSSRESISTVYPRPSQWVFSAGDEGINKLLVVKVKLHLYPV
jgi:hypothetical protein